MTRGVLLLRLALAAVLGICWWKAALAKADPSVEHLMVPSTAMGRDIPMALLAGGPHAVYLPDAFDAGPDVSTWVTAGHVTQPLSGKGISVAARAGSADRTVG
jgi:S-formylglutathione hydrolase FrmB